MNLTGRMQLIMKRYKITKMRYLLILLLLQSCYTANKAIKQVDKANTHYPEVVAKIARDKYPCTDLLKPDTAVIWRDSVVIVDCPDNRNDYFETVRTIRDTVNRIIKVPVTVPVRIQTITKYFEDSAKLKLAALELSKFVKSNNDLTNKLTEVNATAAHRAKENWFWRIIASIIICWQAFKIYKRFAI